MQSEKNPSHSETSRPKVFTNGEADRVVLLGLGNILLSDEGVGVHTINTIKDRYSFDPPIDIIDGGTLGLDLLPLFQDRNRILIIDALDFGKDSGAVEMLECYAIPSVLYAKLSVPISAYRTFSSRRNLRVLSLPACALSAFSQSLLILDSK